MTQSIEPNSESEKEKTGSQIASDRGSGSGHPLMSQTLSSGQFQVLGQASWLMTMSPTHKHISIEDMEWLIMPPIKLNQVRIWRKKNMPVILATWAYLNDGVAESLRSGANYINPHDWVSGSDLWLMDVVAPFGGMETALAQLKKDVFKGEKVRTLKHIPGAKEMIELEL